MASNYNNGIESDAMKDLRRRREELDERNSKLTMEEIWQHERKAKEEFIARTGIKLITVKPPPPRTKNEPEVETAECVGAAT
jgi:hypothetical protein